MDAAIESAMLRERAAWARVWLCGLTIVAAALASGCIAAPGIPAGPLQGTGVTLSGSYGYALAPARIAMQSTVDGRSDHYGDHAADAVNVPFFPSRLGGRVGLTKWFDAAGDISWLDSGLELRAGLPEGSEPFPMALSLSARSGAWGLLSLANRDSTEQRVRFEAYPRLVTWSEGARLNLISTLGVSTGRRFHPLALPDRFAPKDNDDSNDEGPMIPVPEFPNYAYVYRNETRLEGSVGCEVRKQNVFGSLVLMPYAVTGSSHLLGVCKDCENWQIQRFRSNFGAALFFTVGVSFLGQPKP